VTRCRQCRKILAEDDEKCPQCGTPNPLAKGLYQSSTVLISTSGADLVYRSVEEVPVALRTKLIESTNGCNSATILIADQRGRREIAKAMRSLPGPSQRRLLDSMLGREDVADSWLTPARKRIILGLVVLMVLATLALVYAHRWH
jgi:phage FluMu protein Com